MLWHKDDFGYKSFDIFMAISDIDGQMALCALRIKISLGYFIKTNMKMYQQMNL